MKADPYSIANTILKMAKKRAYVDAALSVASLSDIFTQDLEDMPDMHIRGSNATHQANQGKALKEQVITFGKHKGRTLGDLLQNEHGYCEWMANKANNERWTPVFQQLLEEEAAKIPADPETGEAEDAGDIPPAVLRMADKAGMTTEDFFQFVDEKYGKPWRELTGNEKSEVTKHLHELGQAGA